MTMIKPFTCHYVNPSMAADVACPAYDAMTPSQRHDFALANPNNYLNVMRSTEEFPEFERPPFDLNLQRNSQKLQELLNNGTYIDNAKAGFYVYRLEVDGHVQTGLIVELPIEEFINGGIKKHEHTRQDKEEALILYRDEVRASSTPISMSYPAIEAVDAFVARIQTQPALIDFVSPDGLKQTLWFIGAAADVECLQQAFASLDALYLTDGHHRSAVCERWCEKRREENPHHRGDEPYNFVLAAIFPDRENRILEYNRVVFGLNGLRKEQLLAGIKAANFNVDKLIVDELAQVQPTTHKQFSMYLQGEWYRLSADAALIDHSDPVRSLDVCVLQEHILGPLLGIEDPRLDPRIDYVPGAFGLDELQHRADLKEGVAFACYPTSIEELMRVADAGEVMPPKSTWFDPKVRSGLLVRLR